MTRLTIVPRTTTRGLYKKVIECIPGSALAAIKPWKDAARYGGRAVHPSSQLRFSTTNPRVWAVTRTRTELGDQLSNSTGLAENQAVQDGHVIDRDALATFNPYRTEHLNRFGKYAVNPNRIPEPLDFEMDIPMAA